MARGRRAAGLGRGLVTANGVYWPTRETSTSSTRPAAGRTRVVSLAARGVSGGNLLATDRGLLIAGSKELVAFGPAPAGSKRSEEPLAEKAPLAKPKRGL